MKPIPHYPFINYEANQLQHYGDSANITAVYNKITRLFLFGNKQISILHIGGSHVQADIFPHQVRRNLAKSDIGLAAGRGLLFPYKAAKTNAPWNYQLSHEGEWETCKNSAPPFTHSMGITGYAAHTCDSVASLKLKLNRDNTQQWYFNRLKIIAYTTSSPIDTWAITTTDTIKGEYNKEENTYTFNFQTYTDSATIKFAGINKSNQMTLSALLPESNLNGFVYHAIGVNGASVPSWLRCSNFQKELAIVNPDIIILNIGINDANMSPDKFKSTRFINHYERLITRIKTAAPNAALIFITNNDCYYKASRHRRISNTNSIEVREAFIKLAKKHNASIWDMFTIMGGLNSIPQWEEAELARPDKIHFSIDGYKLLGDMFFNAFIYDYLYKHTPTKRPSIK